jgi:hypothetical protein
MLYSRDHIQQALAALAPVPLPIGKQPLHGRGMSRLEFPSGARFRSSSRVQLETLAVAIQHSQQRRIDKPVARIAPFRPRERPAISTVSGKKNPSTAADRHRIE